MAANPHEYAVYARTHNPLVPCSTHGRPTKLCCKIKGLQRCDPLLFLPLCRICGAEQSPNYFGMLRHVRRSQVCISPHHFRRLPTAHFLQVIHRRTVLHQPACPSMSQVVPAKVLNSSTDQRTTPTPCVYLVDRPTSVGKYPLGMLTQLPLQ